MSLADLQLRNVQEFMDAVTTTLPITAGSVTLVVVDHPSTRQRILAVRRLETPAAAHEHYEQHELSALIREEMRTLPIPPWSRDIHTVVVTIIGRAGFNVWTETETTWAMAWRYSNHLTGAIEGDIIVVTEHGWANLFLHQGAAEPFVAQPA